MRTSSFTNCVGSFQPTLHAEAFHRAATPYPEMWTWLPYGPFKTVDEFLSWYESYIRNPQDKTLFAVFDTSTGTDEIAAVIGLLNTSPDHLSTELGFVFTIPPFQRTHVTTHGAGLLLTWCFDELKLRRVQWQANDGNERSWRAAEKLGFVKEGVKRWERVLPPGKGGHIPRIGDPKEQYGGRHTVLLAICWDDWENGAREHVQQRMARQ